ncbi:hypothetical protein AB4Z42_12315 [Mycobacterium sp. 2YAF39]|uniref:hypothetical protein n=1 Tax=Mycobacterium sp. 2YAF39 TaxID=3233033 RepID=UPI003F9B74BA
MNRAAMVIGMSSAVVLGGLACAGGAHAQPPPNPGPCNYTLSPPQVVQVNGVTKVTATLTPAGCLAPWKPKYGIACLSIQGGSEQCTNARNAVPTQVFYEPYQPGATYASTGRGCSAIFDYTTDPNCLLLGPVNATL